MRDSPRPKICATLAFQTMERLKWGAKRAVSQSADLLEFRFDYLLQMPARHDMEWCGDLEVSTIATLRKKDDGGKYRGREQDRLRLLEEWAGIFNYLDLEFASADLPMVEAFHRRGSKIIVSQHDLRSTPPKSELVSMLFRARAKGADICKIATRAESQIDVLNLLSLPQSLRPVVVVPMGREGRIGRILAPIFGSEFAYAHVDGLAPVAPGMLSISTMRRAYGDMLSDL